MKKEKLYYFETPSWEHYDAWMPFNLTNLRIGSAICKEKTETGFVYFENNSLSYPAEWTFKSKNELIDYMIKQLQKMRDNQ
jgi:hypothetical protein